MGRADGRVALAFMGYAATRPEMAERLGAGTTTLRSFLAVQLRALPAAGEGSAGVDPDDMAAALLAPAEGLGLHTLTHNLPVASALAALDAQLDLVSGRTRSAAALQQLLPVMSIHN